MSRQRLLTMLLLVVLVIAGWSILGDASALPRGEDPVGEIGEAATCTHSLGNPYRWGSYVRANASVSCSAVQSYITIVVELAGPNPGSYTYTCYNKSSCSAYVYRDYYSGAWQSRSSAYAPVWPSGSYRQSNWINL